MLRLKYVKCSTMCAKLQINDSNDEENEFYLAFLMDSLMITKRMNIINVRWKLYFWFTGTIFPHVQTT